MLGRWLLVLIYVWLLTGYCAAQPIVMTRDQIDYKTDIAYIKDHKTCFVALIASRRSEAAFSSIIEVDCKKLGIRGAKK